MKIKQVLFIHPDGRMTTNNGKSVKSHLRSFAKEHNATKPIPVSIISTEQLIPILDAAFVGANLAA